MNDAYTDKVRQVFEAYMPHVEGWDEIYTAVAIVGGRYVLVEENTGGYGYWITRHWSLEAAASYHDGNEEPGDYRVEVCIDLLTGARFEAETKTTLTPTLKEETHFEFEAPASWL